MRQRLYTDDTPNLELKEDWEITGQEDMNRLHVKCTQKRSIIDVRDRLNNLKDLITLCCEALSNSELNEIHQTVCDVLYFHVQHQITIAEEELAKV